MSYCGNVLPKTTFRAFIAAAFTIVGLATLLGLTDERAQAATGVDFGIAVTDDRNNLLEQTEAEIGREFDFVRLFNRWEDQFPSNNDLQVLQDRNAMVSVKPQRADGSRIPWADIAAAQPGDALYQEMVDWAQALEPYEDQIWITFHHEPEARANQVHGTDAEFIAAWQNFMTIMNAQGVDPLGRVWIMTDFSFQLPSSDRRQAAKWYPGDFWVDAIAADAYNWFDCRAGTEIDWLSLAQIIEDLRLFGQDHPEQELMLAEFGSVEDRNDPDRKAEWFQEAQTLFARPGYEQFTAVSYFNLFDGTGNFNCDWQFDSSAQSAAAYTAFGNDPFYGGNGPAVPVPPPVPPCTATANGTGYDLEWNSFGTPVVRRNGAWLTTLQDGVMNFNDPNPPAGSTYQVIVYSGTNRTDLTCEVVGDPVTPPPPPPPPADPTCTATVQDDGILLSWDVEGDPIIRRDGFWLATPPANATTFLDTNPSAQPTYLIRTRPDGTVVDTTCELQGDLPVNPVCTITTGAGVELNWTVDGTVNLRKNGNWLATVQNGQSFSDAAGTAADTYLVRVHPAGGGVIDHECV